MAYSAELDSKISAMEAEWNTTGKKIFGETCRLFNGNMCAACTKTP
jgi:hypothetical protein